MKLTNYSPFGGKVHTLCSIESPVEARMVCTWICMINEGQQGVRLVVLAFGSGKKSLSVKLKLEEKMTCPPIKIRVPQCMR